MHRGQIRAVATLAVIGLAFGAGLYAGVGELQTRAANDNVAANTTIPADIDLAAFWKVWQTLEDKYVPSTASSTIPSKEERVWGAIEGLVDSYKDPYTVFLPPKEASKN